jgi:hypothetical protein
MRHELEPGHRGPIEVRHGLGTEAVTVRCETSAGVPVGYLGAIPIDENRVEVAPVPGTDVAAVYVEARPAVG